MVLVAGEALRGVWAAPASVTSASEGEARTGALHRPQSFENPPPGPCTRPASALATRSCALERI